MKILNRRLIMTRRFEKNKNGKVEFTEIELKKLLDEVYNEGYNNGKYCSKVIWDPPYRYEDWWSTTPHITWNTTDLNGTSSTGTITSGNIISGNSSNTSCTSTASLLNTNFQKK